MNLTISKADALDYGFSAMNHAMVLTGVHLEAGKPVRWKIENSWGDKRGEKGYYVCSDTWFDAIRISGGDWSANTWANSRPALISPDRTGPLGSHGHAGVGSATDDCCRA